MVWPLLVVIGGAVTCDSPLAPRPAFISIAPQLDLTALRQFAGLTIDQARVTVIRPPAETLATQTFPFSPDSNQIAVSLNVSVAGTENLLVVFELLAGTQLMFTGQQTVAVTAGVTNPPPTQIPPPTFVGPGAGVATLLLGPRDSGAAFNASVPFRVTARDSSNNPVANFYASWRTSSAVHTIDATGVFQAGNARGTVWVHVATPSGAKDSTRITIAPVPSAVQAASGSGQSGTPGAVLPQPLVARVIAQDGGPVAGVAVTFAVGGGGGSVAPTTVITDTSGLARTTATLGPSAGPNSFTATAAGLNTVTFTANAAAQVITLSMNDTLVAVGGSRTLNVTLSQAAPAGGVSVAVTSDSTGYLTVAAPGTVTIAAGATAGTIALNGVATGFTFVRATAAGYTAGVLPVGVLPPFILLGTGVNVNAGATASLSVRLLPTPIAPVTVTLASSDTNLLRVTTTTLNFASGQANLNATVQGVAVGTVGVTATATGFLQGGAVVTVAGGTPVPTTLARQAGDNQTAFINDTTAIRLVARVRDQGGLPMQNVGVLFTIGAGAGTIGGGSSTLVNTNAAGDATAPAWRLGPTPGSNTVIASIPAAPGVTSPTFTATGQLPPPVIQLSIFGSTVVGQARTGQLDIKLLQAAPAGGVTVTLTTLRSGLLRIGSYTSENGSAVYAQGDTLKSVTVFGDSAVSGVDTVIATAPGYTPDTLAVPISINLISLPPSLTVPLNQTANLGITLSTPAPAGGVQIAVATTDASRVQVQTPTITIPQGSSVGSATLFGAGLGSATVTATNPNYAPFSSVVTTAASLNITSTTVSANASFSTPVVVQLESGGTPVSAPAGGVAVTMTPRNTGCVAAVNTTIPQGVVSVPVSIAYGGSATLPCSTFVVASGPAGFVIDSVNATIQVQPTINNSPSALASGLQRFVSVSLGANNHGGTTIRVTSSNPAIFRVADNDSTPGATFVDLPIPLNGTSSGYYLQSMDGIIADSTTLITTAPGFVPETTLVRTFQPVVDIIFLGGSGNTRSANDPFQLRIGSSTTATGGISTEDEIRAGGATVTGSVVNDSAAVANLVTSATGAGGADSVTVQIGSRQARSPSTVALGGVELAYTGAGVARVRGSIPGFRSVGTAAGQNVTVTSPVLNVSTGSIGASLSRSASLSFGAVAVANDTLRLRASRPGVVKFGTSDSVFVDSLDILPNPGASSFAYFITGVDSIIADSTFVKATMTGFTPDSAMLRVFRPVVDIIFLNGTATTRTANDPFQARIGTAVSATGNISTEDVLRFGAPVQTFSVVNDSSAYAKLVTTATGAPGADSVTVQIGPRQSRSPSTVATGGVELRYTAGGVARVRAASPNFRSTASALGQNVTISSPVMNVNRTVIGAMLQTAGSLTFGAAAVAGDTLRVKLQRPGIVRLGLNDSTFFDDSLVVALTAGQNSISYFVQGVDTITTADSVRVTATIPGFTSDSAFAVVYRPVIDIIFAVSSATALDANDPFQLRIGTPSSPTSGIASEDDLRFGAPPLTVTAQTSAATVAQLVTSSGSGSSVTATIAPRSTRTPTTFAAGGVEQDFLTAGSTVLSASAPGFRAVGTATGQTVTVTAPVLTLNAQTVGSGLQQGAFGNLNASQHGGINVVVKSSNPAVALVSPNVTTPGTDSIIIAVANGSTGFSYIVQGVEGVTGAAQQVTFTATAPGFTQGTATMTIVKPAVDVIFLAATGSAASTGDDPFQVRVGIANAQNSSMNVEQEVRAGAPAPLTVTLQSTQPSFGLLKTTAQPSGAASVTLQIAIGQARTTSGPAVPVANSVSFDFIGAGVTFVVPSIPNYNTVEQTVTATPGFRVTVSP